jgi:hypothetical protein
MRWRSLEVEKLCDEVAASRTSAPLDIASALVKLRRQSPRAPLLTSSFAADDASSFYSRVTRLIQYGEGPRLPHVFDAAAKQFRSFAILAGVFLTSLVICTYFSPIGFHRAAESLLQLLK